MFWPIVELLPPPLKLLRADGMASKPSYWWRGKPPKRAGSVQHSPFRWYFCSVSFFVLGALLYVWCHVRTLSQGEEITALRSERESLIRKQDLLRVQVTGLQKASRIREIAAIDLGMRFPEERPNNLYTAPSAQSTLMGRSVSLQTATPQPRLIRTNHAAR